MRIIAWKWIHNVLDVCNEYILIRQAMSLPKLKQSVSKEGRNDAFGRTNEVVSKILEKCNRKESLNAYRIHPSQSLFSIEGSRNGVNETESFASVLRAMRETSYLADVSCPLLIGKKWSRCPGGADTAPPPPREQLRVVRAWKSELIKAIKLI